MLHVSCTELFLGDLECVKIDGIWRKSFFIPNIFAYMRKMLYFCSRFCKVDITKHNKKPIFSFNKNTKHMKKIFTFAAALLVSMAMSAETIYGPFTLTAENNVANQANEVNGGTATVTTVFPTGSSNELTIDDWTFYKFNSSSAVKCALADDATFSIGDSIFVTLAANASSNKNCGIKLNNSITVSGTIPAGQTATFGYEVVENDGIAGANFFTIYRSSSDSKFGRVWVDRENATPSTDPVESAEISGKNACVLGGSVELTCNAPKATTYQWSMNGAEIEGATAKKYTFTPSAAGEFSFTCAASNEYTATPVVAAAHVVTVSDPAAACGELIKATHTGGKTATVTGVLGGTADKNTQDNGKLGSNGHYFGIKLAAGNFMPGDIVTIVASTLNGGNTATIYSDKGTNLLGSADFDTESLTATYTLEDAVEWVYLYRASSSCNPNVDYIAVSRSCEASNNANIKSLTINGEAVEEVEGVFNYTVGASVDLAQVEVVYTLAHPLATATPASGFSINVPAAGADANTQVITVTAQDGTTVKQYTVSVNKSAQANNDASLSALAVAGYTLDPAFTSDVYAYTITKAYGAENPADEAVSATPNDANAQAPVIALDGNAFTVTVTAEDGTTTLVYTITIVEAAARKDLLEAKFEGNIKGFIANGNINVPYLAGSDEPAFEAARFWNADGEPTAEIVEGNLVVTGIDGQSATYAITYVPVTPMVASYDTITFTEVPSYIYSVYGWDADKGVKFAKDVEEASNHRISEGKSRIYIALPAAQNVVLISGTGAKRPVEVTINGQVVEMNITTPASGAAINFPLDPTAPNFIGIESKGSNGDGGFIKMCLTAPFPTAVENTEATVKAVKVVRNGQLFIEKNGVLYNAQGSVVK